LQALEAAVDSAEALLDGFRGHVLEAIRHPHANYVIQRIVESMPAQMASFVPEALLGRAAEAARNRMACRTVIRIFRHQLGSTMQGANEHASALAEEVLIQASGLVCDEFGNYVIKELLACGRLDFQREIRIALNIDSSGSSHEALLSKAQSKYGSRVVEALLKCFSAEDAYELANDLLANVKSVHALALSEFGKHVLKAILHSGNYSEKSLAQLQQAATDLQSSKQARWLVDIVRNSA